MEEIINLRFMVSELESKIQKHEIEYKLSKAKIDRAVKLIKDLRATKLDESADELVLVKAERDVLRESLGEIDRERLQLVQELAKHHALVGPEETLYCPLSTGGSTRCKTDKCAWFSRQNKGCAVQGIPIQQNIDF
ncbi:MAG: hypothetical protein LBT31_04580 [Synergistaceae bacterium]|nr:hypothetical protein [Synergistaceae bacterium]